MLLSHRAIYFYFDNPIISRSFAVQIPRFRGGYRFTLYLIDKDVGIIENVLPLNLI